MMPTKIKRWFLNYAIRHAFDMEFVNVNERKRFEIYREMNANPEIVLLFKNLYTRSAHALLVERDVIIRATLEGRMLAFKNLLEMMENANYMLMNWEKRKRSTDRIKEISKKFIPN